MKILHQPPLPPNSPHHHHTWTVGNAHWAYLIKSTLSFSLVFKVERYTLQVRWVFSKCSVLFCSVLFCSVFLSGSLLLDRSSVKSGARNSMWGWGCMWLWFLSLEALLVYPLILSFLSEPGSNVWLFSKSDLSRHRLTFRVQQIKFGSSCSKSARQHLVRMQNRDKPLPFKGFAAKLFSLRFSPQTLFQHHFHRDHHYHWCLFHHQSKFEKSILTSGELEPNSSYELSLMVDIWKLGSPAQKYWVGTELKI